MRAFLFFLCVTIAAPSGMAAERDLGGVVRRPLVRATPGASDTPRLDIIGLISGEGIEVEPKSIDFGRIDCGEEREIRSAFAVRVISSKPWVLKLGPTGAVGGTAEGAPIPLSRLQVRSNPTRDFVPVRPLLEIGRGNPTGKVGEIILLDLRLSLDTEDEPGLFDAELELTVEPG